MHEISAISAEIQAPQHRLIEPKGSIASPPTAEPQVKDVLHLRSSSIGQLQPTLLSLFPKHDRQGDPAVSSISTSLSLNRRFLCSPRCRCRCHIVYNFKRSHFYKISSAFVASTFLDVPHTMTEDGEDAQLPCAAHQISFRAPFSISSPHGSFRQLSWSQ